jgi:dTDP-4-amino-4,6-dideoxygalactose transaminase
MKLNRDLASVDPIPASGMARAQAIMQSGALFRYGEFGSELAESTLFEVDFAAYVGRRYAVALNSCGCSLFIALKCLGVEPGDKVLVNAFTLAPVPGAVAHAAAQAVFVESTEDLLIDLDDLRSKAQSSGAKILLLSHMRGHTADLDAVMAICDEFGIQVIEDCAHTMGGKWNGKFTGTFGAIGCFSSQTYKHMNSGEGGILVTDDDDIAAKAILYSGSYMLYRQHVARPSDEVFERYKYQIPNCSMRMSNLAAATARPQIDLLPERTVIWNERHDRLAQKLSQIQDIVLPKRLAGESYVASSIQFRVMGLNDEKFKHFLALTAERGVKLKWFGNVEPVGFTSTYLDWKYSNGGQMLPHTTKIMKQLCDMRIPLSLTLEECDLIVQIIAKSLATVKGT